MITVIYYNVTTRIIALYMALLLVNNLIIEEGLRPV